jgi:hypothetical protein
MQFAVTHEAALTDHPAEAYEPSPAPAKQRRVTTTATLLALALCAFMAKGHLLAAQTPSRVAAAAPQGDVTAPVRIVAPEFCKDQTWPYIDSRCLRRIDNPDAPRATVAPATTAAPTPAPVGGSGNTVAATPPTATTTVAQPTVAQPTVAEPIRATNAPPAAAAPNPTDTRDQVMQSVFPAAAAPDTRTYPATNAYARANNASQRRRSEHWNNQSGFFGFRF